MAFPVTPRIGGICLVILWLGTACAPGGGPEAVSPTAAPEPATPTLASPVQAVAPATTPEDSLADLVALEALHDLEFGSLAKGADHVRGVVSAAGLSNLGAQLRSGAGLPPGPRGGPASAAAPAYDLEIEPFADRARVKYYTDFFLGPARKRFRIWLGRLPRYEGMIRARFRALGVPEDLVYLAIIESGYSNTAVSRSNAVGMWQFIRSTARLYGLTVNTWVDERRDPFKATEAAARHLADLNAQFGSWYLAAAAYNGGAGRVSRGIRRLAADTDSLSDETFFRLSARRYLRRETRDYVPKLIAATLIAKDPAKFGFTSIPYLQPLVFDEITVPDATGLDVIAELADTTSRALMELNPHYIRGVTPPNRTSIVRVPRGTGTKVARRYAELPPGERVSFVEHVVRKGSDPVRDWAAVWGERAAAAGCQQQCPSQAAAHRPAVGDPHQRGGADAGSQRPGTTAQASGVRSPVPRGAPWGVPLEDLPALRRADQRSQAVERDCGERGAACGAAAGGGPACGRNPVDNQGAHAGGAVCCAPTLLHPTADNPP